MQKETGGVFSACPLSLIHISYVSVFQFTQTLKQSHRRCFLRLPLITNSHILCQCFSVYTDFETVSTSLHVILSVFSILLSAEFMLTVPHRPFSSRDISSEDLLLSHAFLQVPSPHPGLSLLSRSDHAFSELSSRIQYASILSPSPA